MRIVTCTAIAALSLSLADCGKPPAQKAAEAANTASTEAAASQSAATGAAESSNAAAAVGNAATSEPTGVAAANQAKSAGEHAEKAAGAAKEATKEAAKAAKDGAKQTKAQSDALAGVTFGPLPIKTGYGGTAPGTRIRVWRAEGSHSIWTQAGASCGAATLSSPHGLI